ncbi:phosphodiesterase [Vulcanibacillus modesticaldus]|uniref:Phosphodiesterase n=1 Tax=Vulcanibacillus modesticaldus TaxID=337097 RepID=A0A1D2YTP0_9BACI|nr:alkaline phosphatase family protein [Vulcanibacillus modesticaldus]OEF99015.1 phosphodiesterase [Vulcanibacillus modesticaldus]
MIKYWRWFLISLIFFSILIIGIGWLTPEQNEADLSRVKTLSSKQKNKKVIMIMIDSLMSKNIEQGIKDKELPAFQFLINKGQFHRNLVSSFPTMSVTIDSTLLTGTTPAKHHIPGLIWFSSEENRIINYGTGSKEILYDGINQVLTDSIVNLNQLHLNKKVSTVYEDLANLNLTSGSVNGLIYRGKIPHSITLPPWIYGLTSLPKKIKVYGPDFLSLGAFSNPLDNMKKLEDSLTKRKGFNNDYAVETLKYLIKNNRLPDFTYIYLPDMDQQIHKKGPNDTNSIKEVDKQLQSLLDSFGSWEKAIDNTIFIIIGDSGQSKVFSRWNDPIVPLYKILEKFNVLPSAEKITDENEIVLAVNERMAYIYLLQPYLRTTDVVNVLKKESKIDIIAWKENGWNHVLQGGTNKEMRFKKGKGFIDPYQQQWQITGDTEVLDINVNKEENSLSYGKYPNALSRLSGALYSHKGKFIVITVRPGYELVGDASPTHIGGGSHGSLHEVDSLVPLIITGTNQKPKYLRMEDLKPFILDLLKKTE